MTLFLNGPVQNGPFTLADRPGKAAGIRLAEALNQLTGTQPAPHLWNTVTLDGDIRHRTAASTRALSRGQWERRELTAKYAPGPAPAAGILTDTAPQVAALALQVCQELLANGTLTLARVPVRLCLACDHMTGAADHACRACTTGAGTRPATRRLLVHDRPEGRPVLERADFHAMRASTPAHLMNIAHNAPRRLLLSRTRAHGISLGPLGLDDMVLDPRLGLHLAVLATAAQRGEDRPVMTITQNAAAHVAAYGAPVRRRGGMQLRYALHGRIPYDGPLLRRLYEAHRVTPWLQKQFTEWHLPLCAWRERAGITAARLPSLLKFLRRAALARPDTPADEVLAELGHSVKAGDRRWVMDARAVAHALAHRAATHGSGTEPPEGDSQ
ncbi:hypothetical protein [Streptomyces halobius]|uniref:Uncharacterized protein n=1 Tax=Streptomyces halobius TaxID=2879846 RepID=A0ABY4M112_9ACTN|nr:hypothetical protein [Streptomyces halobius]UQA91459.1 hypothetical protein K9S39_05820 [Streptomyces halobius]